MGLSFKSMIKIIGILTLIEGVFMLPVVFTAIHFEEWQASRAFAVTAVCCMVFGLLAVTRIRSEKLAMRAREGYFIAFLSWLYCSLLGAVPMYFCGSRFSFISCFFESVAGFSTTGCSVLDLDIVPMSMLLWRAMCHWLGGMGILILLISIFPLWGINNQSLATAETPGTHAKKIEATYSDTGKFLYLAYLILSVVEFALLWAGPMDWFNALLTTCSSISTAGLMILPESAWMYELPYVMAIVTVFTILSSISFIVYFLMLKGKWKEALKNYETKIFFFIIAVSTILIAVSLTVSGTYSSVWRAVRDSFLQVVSFISTSGYFVCDYTAWPSFASTILVLLLFIGGCSFSTSGSLKVIRVTVLFKLIKRGLLQQIHPNMVRAVMMDGKPVPARIASSITTHTMLFFGIFAMGCILLSFNDLDMETTITTSIGMLANTGVALGMPGGHGYFGMFNEFSQLVMSLLMIAGRLEMYAMVIVFARSFWKPDKAVAI